MRYLPILEELCSSDSVLFMVVGIIVALVISVKFCDTKRNLIGLIGSFVVYAICEVLTNFYTNYMLEIALLFDILPAYSLQSIKPFRLFFPKQSSQ